jgi:hypothetical protein
VPKNDSDQNAGKHLNPDSQYRVPGIQENDGKALSNSDKNEP